LRHTIASPNNGLCHRVSHTGRRTYSLQTNIKPLRPTPTLAAPLATLFPTPHAPKHPESLHTDLRTKIETASESGRLGIDISCAKHARHIPFKRGSSDLSPFRATVFLPFNLTLGCLIPGNLYDAAGTRTVLCLLYALLFVRHGHSSTALLWS
jgi:hypothetical protein